MFGEYVDNPPGGALIFAVANSPLQFRHARDAFVEFQPHNRGYIGPLVDRPAFHWAAAYLAGIVARFLFLKPDLKAFKVKTIFY